MRRQRLVVLVVLWGALSASIAACGGVTPRPSAPGHGLVRSDAFCERTLSGVRHTTAFNTPGSLQPGDLIRTANALRRVRSGLEGQRRPAEHTVARAADRAARAIEAYVRDNQNDAGNASGAYDGMYSALIDLDQVAGDQGLPACALIVTS